MSLPENASDILGPVTHCLITHSQKFGIKALQHTDHLDPAGESFLRNNNIPVITRRQDASYPQKSGISVVATLNFLATRNGAGWSNHGDSIIAWSSLDKRLDG